MGIAVAGVLELLLLTSLVVVVVQAFRRRWKSLGIWIGIGFATFVTMGIIANAAPHFVGLATETPRPLAPKATPRRVATEVPTVEPKTVPVQTEAPVQEPPTRAAQKAAFLTSVDESVSGARIAGNPFKFVGTNVDLHCTVSDIPQSDFFNATCGSDSDGAPVNIVIQADSTELEKGQAIRVLGTVVAPMDGTNAMGGSMHFPTVQAEFMQ